MAGSYTATEYATVASVIVAINAVAAGKLAAVVPFKDDGNKQKFIVVVAA